MIKDSILTWPECRSLVLDGRWSSWWWSNRDMAHL